MSIKELSKDIVGKGSGAVIGYTIGGSVGAAVGATSAELIIFGLDMIGRDFAERVLSPREDEKVGRLYLYARNKFLENLKAGKRLREDELMKQPPAISPACIEIPIVERPPYEEIFEGFLLSVQREHEEKKLPFIANLLGNVFFDSNIDIAQINLLLKLSEATSYRQLCILSMFAHPERFNLRKENYRGLETLGEKRISLLQEITDLDNQGLMNCSGDALLGLSDVNPSKMRIQGTGAMLYNLMELGNIDNNDLLPILSLLE